MTKRLPQNAREWKSAAAFAGISGAIVQGVQMYCGARGLPELGELGDMLSGVAALLAVVGGAIGWYWWGEREAAKKRAEVAGAAIIAAFDLHELLKLMCPYGIKLDPSGISKTNSEEDRGTRRGLLRVLERKIVLQTVGLARSQLVGFMPNEAHAAALDALWKRRQKMANFMDIENLVEHDFTADSQRELFDAKAIEGEFAALKAALREYAAFGAKHGVSRQACTEQKASGAGSSPRT